MFIIRSGSRIDQCRVVTLELLKRTDRNTPSVSAQTCPGELRVLTANILREKLTSASLSERVLWCLWCVKCDVYCEASRLALSSCSVMTANIDLSDNILFLSLAAAGWTIFHAIVTAGIAWCFTQTCSSPVMSSCRANEQFSKLCP